MQVELAATDGLEFIIAAAESLNFRIGVVVGLTTSAGTISAPAVVLTTGTFLGGMMHRGADRQVGGRLGAAASDLGEALRRLGLPVYTALSDIPQINEAGEA